MREFEEHVARHYAVQQEKLSAICSCSSHRTVGVVEINKFSSPLFAIEFGFGSSFAECWIQISFDERDWPERRKAFTWWELDKASQGYPVVGDPAQREQDDLETIARLHRLEGRTFTAVVMRTGLDRSWIHGRQDCSEVTEAHRDDSVQVILVRIRNGRIVDDRGVSHDYEFTFCSKCIE